MTKNDSEIIVFDTETTGKTAGEDQIIEITIQFGLAEDAEIKTKRIKPHVAIKAEATAVHGIRMEDLKDCHTFKEYAKGIREIFEKAETIIGYNVKFDLDFLQSEFLRAKLPPLDLSQKKIIDPLRIWQNNEKRDLSAAYERFVGGKFEKAHSAEADVKATSAVFKGMLKAFKLEGEPLEELAKLTFDPEWVGYSHHIQWRSEIPTFTFGKLKDRPVWEAVNSDASYLEWMQANNFPPHVVDICKKAVSSSKEDFLQSVTKTYGKPQAASL